jgi:threonine/homoserine/homoserine lactone efflux protein
MNLHVLPLAIVMVAGTQIVVAILLVTGEKPVKPSITYVAGFGLSVCTGIAVAMLLGHILHVKLSSSPHGKSVTEKRIELALAILLILESIRIYLKRADAKPPKLLETLQTASPKATFKLGVLMILAAPADIMVMATVGLDLIRNHNSFVDALPFIGLTLLLLAAPLIVYLLLGRKAEPVMAKVREWMRTKSWAVNIAVCVLFIYLLLS